MARVDVSMSSDVEPESAWKLASDLNRFDEWMTIFGGWRGTVPSTIEDGTCVSSLIKVRASATSFTGRSPVTTTRNQLSYRVAVEAGFASQWR